AWDIHLDPETVAIGKLQTDRSAAGCSGIRSVKEVRGIAIRHQGGIDEHPRRGRRLRARRPSGRQSEAKNDRSDSRDVHLVLLGSSQPPCIWYCADRGGTGSSASVFRRSEGVLSIPYSPNPCTQVHAQGNL